MLWTLAVPHLFPRILSPPICESRFAKRWQDGASSRFGQKTSRKLRDIAGEWERTVNSFDLCTWRRHPFFRQAFFTMNAINALFLVAMILTAIGLVLLKHNAMKVYTWLWVTIVVYSLAEGMLWNLRGPYWHEYCGGVRRGRHRAWTSAVLPDPIRLSDPECGISESGCAATQGDYCQLRNSGGRCRITLSRNPISFLTNQKRSSTVENRPLHSLTPEMGCRSGQ